MRIVVRDLPRKATKEEIEREFSRHGRITDVFMLRNETGEFRRTCFIGYLEEEAGIRAMKYHDGSFFLNQRIRCEAAKEQEERSKKDESEERRIKYSRQLFVGGIPDCMAEDSLRGIFEKHGEINNIEIMDQKSGRNACIEFSKGESAVEAYRNVKLIGGRNARISAWRSKPTKKCHEHYNSLFFNFESIVRTTCENEGVGIRDLVNIKDKDLGSRMALLETHLVQQTREFLENNGIFLDRLSGETDKKILILRNMDLMSCLDLVKGECKIGIAPSKCLALLRFKTEEEALECYKRLNLRRMKEHVIYCEYAPICKPTEGLKEVKTSEEKIDDGVRGLSNKLLVRNVPFQASEEEIMKMFKPHVHVVSVRIPIKREGSSRGFCFITLNSAEDVTTAIEYFGSSTHLYGRRLVLERAKS